MSEVATAAKGSVAGTKGLEGVIAANSEICFIDGKEGRLLYQGYNIHELADKSTFEEVCCLLWRRKLPTRTELNALDQQLRSERAVPAEVMNFLRSTPKDAVPMTVLRTAVSMLALYDRDAEDISPDANLRKAVRLTAQTSTILCAFHRLRNGLEPVAPNPKLAHAANFLYMLRGAEPNDVEARCVDLIFILHADHSLNASTFAGRVIGSTLADMHSAVTGAIGGLKGPLHGGANQRVLEVLAEIGDVSRVEPYVKDTIAKGGKIMGFGHRVYKVEDPRAAHLKDWAKSLAQRTGNSKWYDMSVEMERIVKEEKQISVNVDFYSATVQLCLGIPADLFTCIFAASRMAGWTAHIIEQQLHNRLIRPLADYIGPAERPYVAVDQR
jgi:citrate synthase